MSNVTDDDDKIVKNSWTPEVRSTRRRETFSRRRRRHSGPRPTTVRKSFSSATTVLNRSGLRALGAPTRPILAHESPDDVDLLTNTEHPLPNSAGGCAPSRADPEARGPGQLDRYRRGSARSLEQELPPEVSPARPPSSSISSRTPRIADRGSALVCRTHRRFARSFPALSGTPRRAPSPPPTSRVQSSGSNPPPRLPRRRWCNQLNPMVKRGPFTEDEDRAILVAHAIHGNKWAVISRSIPGR